MSRARDPYVVLVSAAVLGLAAVIVLAVVLLIRLEQARDRCEDAGGILVRTPGVGRECIDRDVVR